MGSSLVTQTLTFMDALLQGKALISDYRDWQLRWHRAVPNDPIKELELNEYLGLTPEEYAHTVTHRSALKAIAAARRNGETFDPETHTMQDVVAPKRNLESAQLLIDELRNHAC